MRTLRRYRLNNKTEVKFWQGYLSAFEGIDVSIDGAFGPKTVAATKEFQKRYGLAQDGSCGPMTQAKAGFMKTRNANIVVQKVPFSKIECADVLLKDKQAYNCRRFATEGGYDVVWNGGFFEMKSLRSVQLIMINGEIKTWGMGYEGIAYDKPFTKAVGGDAMAYTNKPYDMQGGAPILIFNYLQDNESMDIFKYKIPLSAKRNCTAVSDDALFLFFSLTSVTSYDMMKEGLNQKVRFMQNNDGGGSQSIYMGGGYVITTDGRSIPTAVGLKIRRK